MERRASPPPENSRPMPLPARLVRRITRPLKKAGGAAPRKTRRADVIVVPKLRRTLPRRNPSSRLVSARYEAADILYRGIIFDFLKVWKRWESKVSRAALCVV